MTDQTLFRVPPKLTERQQYVYRLTEQTTVTADQAGAELHKRQRCPYCTPDTPCPFATSNGREVLESLRKKGMVKRDRHHVYRRVETTSMTPKGPVDWGKDRRGEFPEGF